MGNASPEFDAGYVEGFEAGRREGFAEGHRVGFFEGHRAGWEERASMMAPAGLRPPEPARLGMAAESRAPFIRPPAPLRPAPLRPVPPRPARQSPPTVPRLAQPPTLRPVSERYDAEDIARRRRRRGILNANIALYAASLLIVAAAALFLASSASDGLRLTALFVVTAVFYATGLLVHARVARLRPAAVAFTGTGLALLPVSGLAVDVLAVHNTAVTWFATSLVGLVAFGAAAVRLESRILVYASITFAFSGAWSAAAGVGGALAVDFAALLALSAGLGVLVLMRPRWVPRAYLRPLVRVHPLVAPAVLAAATIAARGLERWQYPGLAAAVCASLAVTALVRGPALVRRLSWWGARGTAVLAMAVGSAQAADVGWLGNAASGVGAAIGAAAVASAVEVFLVVILGDRLEARLGLTRDSIALEQAAAVGGMFLLVIAAVAIQTAGMGSGPVPVVVACAAMLLSAQLVGWWHGGAAEWLPCAAIASLPLAQESLEPTGFAVLVVWGAAYWLSRARWPRAPRPTSGRPWRGGEFIAAARYASLLAAPSVVNACLPSGWSAPERVAPLSSALAGAAAAQLMLTALLRVLGITEFGRRAAVVIMSVAASAGCAAAAVTATSSVLYGLTAAAVCLAAVALTAALFGRGDAEKRDLLVGELAPPILVAVLAGEAYAADEWGIGNGVLFVLALVFWSCAVRSFGSPEMWTYLWLARASGSALVLGVFHAMERDGWHLSLGGQALSEWHVLAAVTLAQLWIPLVAGVPGRELPDAGIRGRVPGPFPWALGDAAVTLGVATAALVSVSAVEGLAGQQEIGTLTSALWVALTVGASTCGVVLRRRPAALAFVPAVLVLSPLAARGDLRLLEISIGLCAAYAAAMVYLAPGVRLRGAHLLAARALPLILAGLVARDATASPTVLSLVFAVGLALQHAVRGLLKRTTAGLPFQGAAYWSGLAAQLALPAAYAVTSRSEAGGGRWVLIVETAAFLALVWVGPALAFPPDQLLSAPLLTSQGFVLVSALLAVVHVFGLGRRGGPGHRPLWPWTSGGAVFASAAVASGIGQEPWVFGVAAGAAAALLITTSWVWRGVAGVAQSAFPLGVLGFLIGGTAGATSVFAGEAEPWRHVLPLLVGALVPAGIGLALRWAPVWLRGVEPLDEPLDAPILRLGADPVRRWSIVAAAALALLLAACVSWDPPAAHLLPGLAGALVALAVSEAPSRWLRSTLEVGAVVVLAATQRAVFGGTEEPSLFWLAQWYIVAAGVVALLRYIAGDRRNGQRWLAAAAGAASLAGLASAAGADSAQQVWLLLVFVSLTVAGLAGADRRFTAWGALGVLACVLWAVRAYPYLLLAGLGLALIGAAVWWLLRASRGTLLR